MADFALILSEAAGEAHATPTAFGMDATVYVSLAMLVFIGILVWKKVPAAIGAALDRKIAAIRDQLAEAESLRKEAEALKAEYVAKAAAAESEAKAMLDRARHEADAMIEKARKDADALVERRGRMAEEKIAAGTFFQTRIAITTIMAIEIAIGAVRKPNAVASVSCDGTSVPVDVCASDIHFGFHCLGGLLWPHRLAG